MNSKVARVFETYCEECDKIIQRFVASPGESNEQVVLSHEITSAAVHRLFASSIAKFFEEEAKKEKVNLAEKIKQLNPTLVTPPGTKALSVFSNSVLEVTKTVRNGPSRLNTSKLMTELIRAGIDPTIVNASLKASMEEGEPQELYDILLARDEAR